jgi:tripartite-type tricarboxylate transporter receptor subunit TctC
MRDVAWGDGVTRRSLLRTTFAATGASFLGSGVWAQGYPSRQIRIIVPFPAAGGPLDLTAHLLSNELRESGGPGAVVENRVGAGGSVGASSVLKAEPDGYTILCANGFIYGVGKLLFGRPDFDPHKFEPIGVAVEFPAVLVAHPDVPFSTIADFIAYAKQNPAI